MNSATIENLQKDLEEIESFINASKRLNVKRYLEDSKRTVASMLESEKKLASETKVEKNDEPQKKEETSENIYNYVSIQKYGFENGDKFAK